MTLIGLFYGKFKGSDETKHQMVTATKKLILCRNVIG